MTQFTQAATSRTPYIHLNDVAGTLEITGESYPEDVRRFYATLSEQLAVFFASKPTQLLVTIHLSYFNSGSARALMELLDQLDEAAARNTDISINWYCDPDDDITREFAEDIAMDIQTAKVNILETDDGQDG